MTIELLSDTAKPDHAFIKRAIAQADPNALRIALHQATGDTSLLSMIVSKVKVWGEAWQVSTISAEDAEIVRAKAAAFLQASTPDQLSAIAATKPDAAMLETLITAYTGDTQEPFLLRWGRSELALEEFPRQVEWRQSPQDEQLAKFHVLIIGAGMSGLAAAIQLRKLGIPFTVVDRQDGIGGTWKLNDYPDARVDVPSHHYEYSFEKNYPWKHYFAAQPELLEYLNHCARKYDVADSIRLSTEIVSARWDEATSRWRVSLRNCKSQDVSLFEANVVISATGVFHSANLPDIPGIETFGGKIVHTTQWDHGFDYHGKRIGLIGNGSTGVQLMPRMARAAGHLTVFQRTPSWMMEMPGYYDPVSQEAQWLFDTMPFYRNWYRYGLFYGNVDNAAMLQEYDRDWQAAGGRISERHDTMSTAWQEFIIAKVGDDPELLAKCMPSHIPWAKRPIVESGWYDCLRRPNVDLVTDDIRQIVHDGVETADGQTHPLDLLILACGFEPNRFLWPVDYRGRDGITLEQQWEEDGARAYLGLSMPNFPNFFTMYGPNGQPRSVGVFMWSEAWAHYIVEILRDMIEQDRRQVECRRDVFEEYNAKMDAMMTELIWAHPGQTNYYINGHGRVGVNMPWRTSDYYRMIEHADLGDYELR